MLKALTAPNDRVDGVFTAPFTFFSLVLPFGISTGHMTVACILAAVTLLRWLNHGSARREGDSADAASLGPEVNTMPVAQTE